MANSNYRYSYEELLYVRKMCDTTVGRTPRGSFENGFLSTAIQRRFLGARGFFVPPSRCSQY